MHVQTTHGVPLPGLDTLKQRLQCVCIQKEMTEAGTPVVLLVGKINESLVSGAFEHWWLSFELVT